MSNQIAFKKHLPALVASHYFLLAIALEIFAFYTLYIMYSWKKVKPQRTREKAFMLSLYEGKDKCVCTRSIRGGISLLSMAGKMY